MNRISLLFFIAFLFSFSCREQEKSSLPQQEIKRDILPVLSTSSSPDTSFRTIHVFVALCDNKYQGIVPVPAGIGNGQDPKTNLYWGAGYGVKSFFIRKSQDWQLISTQVKPVAGILERLLLKHRTKKIYLLADAYDGQLIRQTTIDFFEACAGKKEITVQEAGKTIGFGGAASLLAYVGHDGLMDFSLDQSFERANNRKREALMLACYSKHFFSPHLKNSDASPLLWTSGLMAPEAYTLHDAIREWAAGHSSQQVRTAAAQAYSKYQHCSFKAAQNLLVQGW